MARTGFYNQSATSVILDGTTLTDLGDEFAYRIEKPDTQSSLTIGTERAVTNFTSNKTVTLNLSLLPESESVDLIADLEHNQQRGRGREFDVTIFSTEGEVLACNGCSIRQGAGAEGGGQAGVSRQYILNVKEFLADTSNF